MNSHDKIRNAIFNLCEKYASEIAGLYDNAILEISELMKGVELDEKQPFNFEDYGLQEKVDDIMDRLEASVMKKVGDGVLAAYAMSYKNCEELVRRVVGDKVKEDVLKAFLPKIRSDKAARAFMNNVPSISGRLWNGETLALMTSAIEDGISQGMSAKKMASRIKEYLNDPNDWHRRFRYKIGEDEDGNSIFGRKWKKREWDESEKRYKWVDHKPGDPHPGHVGGSGAYRSSYKNALRYTRTTINIAYRTADYDQYQSLPFVRGIEIRLSNNHPVADICDDLAGVYPKDFKWTGWHPNCRCYQIPVLAKPEEVDKMVDSILDGGEPDEVNVQDIINDLPDNFKKWTNDNKERIVSSSDRGTLPYFIRDNKNRIEVLIGKLPETRRNDAIAEEVSVKLKKAEGKSGHLMFVSIEPMSPIIISAIQSARTKRIKNGIYESILNDDRATILNDFNGHKTILFPGHRGTVHASWIPTQKMAFELNEHGMDVAFLAEKTGDKYADSIIKMSKNRYIFADFKYCTTTKYNTLGEDLIDGFWQANNIVLKAPNMDTGRLCSAIEQVKRKMDNYGNIMIINKSGDVIEISRRDIKSGRFRIKLKGFL